MRAAQLIGRISVPPNCILRQWPMYDGLPGRPKGLVPVDLVTLGEGN